MYDGEDEAIPPHTTIPFSLENIRWGAQSVPASVSIDIGSVKTESELPPVTLPKAGDYLYRAVGDENLANISEEHPVELLLHIDQGGYGRTALFKEGEKLDKAIELLCGIKIAEEAEGWVTDNYNWIRLVWEDGSDTYISLNMYNLEYPVHSNFHVYTLENLDAFWSYAEQYVIEDK